MAGLGKTFCKWVWNQWVLVWGTRKGAILWGQLDSCVGESGLRAGRVIESWPCLKAPSTHTHLFSCSFIYELEHFNGVAELLEILGR